MGLEPKLTVGAQCRLLSISRSSFSYSPQGETAMNLDIMLLIDKPFLDPPFYGVQQMTWHLRNEGYAVNDKRIRRLMRLMRVRRENGPLDRFQNPSHCQSIRSRTPANPPRGTRPTPTDPYLLGGLQIHRPNQGWCTDITYLPMRRIRHRARTDGASMAHSSVRSAGGSGPGRRSHPHAHSCADGGR